MDSKSEYKESRFIIEGIRPQHVSDEYKMCTDGSNISELFMKVGDVVHRFILVPPNLENKQKNNLFEKKPYLQILTTHDNFYSPCTLMKRGSYVPLYKFLSMAQKIGFINLFARMRRDINESFMCIAENSFANDGRSYKVVAIKSDININDEIPCIRSQERDYKLIYFYCENDQLVYNVMTFPL
jgi:hypothetical protein